jgi:apolipoprotein D and lipocalin family protein
VDIILKRTNGYLPMVQPNLEEDIAALKVSFFGPFYGYNVVALEDYKYALVAGKNLDYLWILSREKTIPENVKQNFITKAQEIGYDTSNLSG